jgi:DNA-binding CsgD family transcriptional regulator
MKEIYAKLNNNTASTQRHNFHKETSDSQVYLLQAVIESFVDGILILTTEGEVLHINDCARHVCRQLMGDRDKGNAVPKEVWHVCESLIDSRDIFPEENIFMEYQIETDSTVSLRIRARWLQLGDNKYNYVLVTLEDRQQTTQSIAIADARKYGLTDREAEVWLLRRADLSYQQIADKLFITINTVKKHLKNIYAKQHGIMCLQ